MSQSSITPEARLETPLQESDDNTVIWLDDQRRSNAHPLPIISVILVTYQTGEPLDKCIASILEQDFPFELVIVDNGNPKDVSKKLEKLAETRNEVIIRSGQGNVGFARACNIGVKAASGHHILLLNPDTELPQNTLDKMFREALHLPRPWMFSPAVLNPDGSEQRGARRETLTPWSALVEGTKLYKLMPNHPQFSRFNNNESEHPTEIVETPVISGSCMFLPKEDYWAIGGMDENYFLHVEDIDFCFRFRHEGGIAYYAPNVTITHHASSSKVSPFFVEWHKLRGFCRYFTKNFSDYYPKPFIYLVNMGISAFFLVKLGKAGLTMAMNFIRRR